MKQLNCEQAKDLFEQDIDGEISAEDKALLTAHLASCENCRREYGQLKAVGAYLHELAAEIPPELHENVMANIQKEKTARAKRFRRIRILAGTAAAAVVCVAVLHTPLLNVSNFAKKEADMSIESPMENASASTKTDHLYSSDMPDGGVNIGGSGITADEALPEIYLPDKSESATPMQKGYRIEETPYIVWLHDEQTAAICYDNKDGTTELVLSVEYSLGDNILHVTANGEYQLFDVNGSTLVPTEGNLLEKLKFTN